MFLKIPKYSKRPDNVEDDPGNGDPEHEDPLHDEILQ